MKIVFVCTGNTCRSPMAAALFEDILNDRKGNGAGEAVVVQSAGLYAYGGDPASAQAREVMAKEYKLDLTNHRATVLDDSHIRDTYLLLTMTRHHKEMLLDIYPEAADRVFTLKEFAEIGTDGDISDPYGQDYDAYRNCALEMEELLTEVIDKLFDNKEGLL